MPNFFVGTSGFAYTSWRGSFYPEDLPSRDFLRYYCRHFPAVELNVTFYRWPRAETLKTWRQQVGPEFRFAVKVHRSITHRKRLIDCHEELSRLQDLCHLLRPSVLLVQLPPSLQFAPERFADFRDSLPGDLPPLAWEGRHPSFGTEEAAAFFRRFSWSLVMADSGGRFPTFKVLTSLPLYLRFHGPGRLYASPYSKAQLAAYVRWARELLPADGELYAFFNNDVGGYALGNAKEFAALLQTREVVGEIDEK